ncbi:hypothetical protein GIY23_08825 [Allosaccharopolyspora coralli]|uniref:SnoaL-like domain-containing protein n=1 Tax=Allosaccharopolyspora coralli TaxID=2665642 RepID=A0A5Q3QFK9_9PSEU|nr:nuclear transport factor 2 family protein [Allosaccharopolyspora coralli]QGK69607.1 hypothetical protein GIY23_08825 [Allosaccharopolyspora coralli]
MRLSSSLAVVAGGALALGARAALPHLIARKVRSDLDKLNAGDHRPMLAAYADDAILRFPVGDHRWSGEHRGKTAIERFLREFTAAGLFGEITELHASGPPWRMTLLARFDDHALGPRGQRLYDNRAVLLGRLRWGKIVEHEDFFADTGPLETLERRLRELDRHPVT